jgi:hypothetical protein
MPVDPVKKPADRRRIFQIAGTDVGGIPEVIGGENTVPLGDGLIDGLSGKALSMLRNPQSQSLPPELDWAATASKELAVIKEIL